MALLHGMDIASGQAGINLRHAKDAFGLVTVYVKLGGDNVGRYVAPHYAEEVDAVRAAGIDYVGHYWVPGRQDPVGAADYFVAHLRHFDKRTDYVVLDNETLDRGAFYGDADAARFCERVMAKLGIPAAQVIVYFPAAPVLRAMKWPRLEKLGISPLVASYGANTGHRDHEPNMGGRFGDRWAAHQYTSQGRLDGWGGALDLDVFQPSFFSSWAGKKPTTPAAPAPAPKPAPASSGAVLKPTKAEAEALQSWARLGGYDGPIDGSLGERGWTAIQGLLAKGYGYAGAQDGAPGQHTYEALQRFAAKLGGYEGAIDGEPGARTWQGAATAASKAVAADKAKKAAAKAKAEADAKAKAEAEKAKADAGDELTRAAARAAKALQTWAKRGGYHGPIDGVLGEHSWTAIQTLLARSYGYHGAVDGKPGQLTFEALQRLAKKGGYSGPIDGALGVHSWTGIAKALGA